MAASLDSSLCTWCSWSLSQSLPQLWCFSESCSWALSLSFSLSWSQVSLLPCGFSLSLSLRRCSWICGQSLSPALSAVGLPVWVLGLLLLGLWDVRVESLCSFFSLCFLPSLGVPYCAAQRCFLRSSAFHVSSLVLLFLDSIGLPGLLLAQEAVLHYTALGGEAHSVVSSCIQIF